MILFFLFFYALALTITIPVLLPALHLAYFAPLIIFALYRQSKITCLWLGLACGMIFDLLSAQMLFGIYALNYTLTTYILYKMKNHFFEDSVSTIPIMTLFFSLFSAIIQLFLVYTLNGEAIFSWEWIKMELIKTPIYNSIYAILTFTLPSVFFPRRTKKAPNLVMFKGRL